METVRHCCGGDCDDGDAGLNLLDADGDGSTTCSEDCNDLIPAIHPDATELCEIDNTGDRWLMATIQQTGVCGIQIWTATVWCAQWIPARLCCSRGLYSRQQRL